MKGNCRRWTSRSPDILQAEHVNGTRDQFFFLLEELCGATLQPCEGVFEICIFKERLTALTRPRSNKVAMTSCKTRLQQTATCPTPGLITKVQWLRKLQYHRERKLSQRTSHVQLTVFSHEEDTNVNKGRLEQLES